MQSTRWFTTKERILSNSIHMEDEWSVEALQLLETESFCTTIPAQLKPVEENTLPSWLWRHSGNSESIAAESNVSQVFARVAGAAVYAGWKKDLFSDETEARAFYDEIVWMLSHRVIAMEPAALAALGIDWAYGFAPVQMTPVDTRAKTTLSITNQSIDAILSASNHGAQNRWRNFLKNREGELISLRFSDTLKEWETTSAEQMPRLTIDLLKLCRDDGRVDIASLQHVARLSVILLELHYDSMVAVPEASRALAIGYNNLASMLMRQGIAYDSEAGRSTAAAISSIITTAATIASAQLAQKLGPCAAFSSARASFLRILGNRHRAAYGDANDYEHVSVLPLPLKLDDCPDLTLIAAARKNWDDALIATQRYGLRHTQLTSLFASHDLMALQESSTGGISPEPQLVREKQTDAGTFSRKIIPAAQMGLVGLGYDDADIKSIVSHAVGYGSLKSARGVNHETLKARGFTDDAIEKIEEQIPSANNIRMACTPWVVGENFCLNNLKIPADKLDDFGFDLLEYIGFSKAEIIAANHFCYGHGNMETASELKHEHRAIFACGEEISVSAKASMAASVQSFITGDVNLTLTLSSASSVSERSDLLLNAWRNGLKNVAIYFEYAANAEPAVAQPVRNSAIRSRALPKSALISASASKNGKRKAPSRVVSMRGKSPSSSHKTRA
ncbi:MAG: hypothetical protein PHX43_01590 [Alphaproteobacteria bacterium]|nr:hypothetical protein [Alphaproteobacteria bacterium]